MRNKTLYKLLYLLIPAGSYFEPLPPQGVQPSLPGLQQEDRLTTKTLYQVKRRGRPIAVIEEDSLVRHGLWKVMKKDNELAFRRSVDRYRLSPIKILGLRKNNPIKKTYKSIAWQPKQQ